ncbi:hypothetical protein AUR64_13285 [Haloprofundus marisrubri]|uniref:Uncharacterized protein n=1 Tax=Haloprofundus marisrubri TaxID=1514971 RepID=A0A0W1R5S4_9EURY|nr:hypothetical protein [Haloprofundus marisrubri]KTG08794.1 hypothetical protein AUR64_13285 [Haloprofundus marisrubri]
MSNDAFTREDQPRLTGVCPVDDCEESFVGISVATLRDHVVDAHGYLALLETPGLHLVPEQPQTRRRGD